MGMSCCYPAPYKNIIPNLDFYVAKANNPTNAIAGFSSITMTATTMVVKYYDHDGIELFSSNLKVRSK